MSEIIVFTSKPNAAELLQPLFDQHTLRVVFHNLRSLRQLKRIINAAPATKIVIAAGGDGTVNAAVNAIHGKGITLGVIPLGTLNHFAKDLGIPLDTEAAVACIAQNHAKTIDVARVNATFFVNNSSIGLYPDIVQMREKHQSVLSKWPAALLASIVTLSKIRSHRVAVKTSGSTRQYRTPFIFVGNNKYHLQGGIFSDRRRLDEGILSVYIIKSEHFLNLALLTLAVLIKKTTWNEHLTAITSPVVTLSPRHRHIRASFDGETGPMQTPLRYAILARSLKVLVPR